MTRLLHIILKIITISLVLLSTVFIFSIFYYDPVDYYKPLVLGSILIGLLKPDYLIILVLFCLAIFGNKPATNQSLYLSLLLASSVIGLFLKLRFKKIYSFTSNKILVCSFFYIFISLLSLSTPLLNKKILLEFSWRWEIIAANVIYFFQLSEDKLAYPILSVFHTLSSWLLSYYIYVLIKEKKVRAIQFSIAIFFGLVFSLVIGLLDYYQIINLRFLRALDPTVNPGDAQFRLQSFFGHSGWFAEYITMTIPYIILILLFKRITRTWKIILIIASMILGEFVLILTFQRGGWISYPITLFIIWAAIYSYNSLERGEVFSQSLKSSLKKILISLPLTVIFSFAIMTIIHNTGTLKVDRSEGINSYVERFKDIKKTSDRSDFMYAGWLIGKLHPLFGAGSESFCSEFEKEFVSPQGRYYNLLNLPLHGTAHNVYFQTFSGKGILGLLSLLLLIFSLIEPVIKIISQKVSLTKEDNILLLCSFCFACSVLIYGMVQEVFYINSLQVLFFAVTGITAALTEGITTVSFNIKKYFLIIFGLFFLHILWEKGVNKLSYSKPQEYGCFQDEVSATGENFKWCSEKAVVVFPAKTIKQEDGSSDKHFIDLKLAVDFLQPGKEKTKIKVYEISQSSKTRLILEDYLPALSKKDYNLEILNLNDNGEVTLLIKSDSSFVPAAVFEGGMDFRVLSFKVFK